MTTTIRDATIAAVAVIIENLAMLPADKARCAAFFGEVISAAIEAAIIADRRERMQILPSEN